jgi:hypothetical protein
LSRGGAVRYLDLTASASAPADYLLFPNHPRRTGLRIYQLSPAVAIQDHLLEPGEGGQAFATAMAGRDGSAAPRRAWGLEKLGRESGRLAEQLAGWMEWTYQKAFLRLETTRISVG